MEYKRYDIKIKRLPDWVSLHFLADIHYGGAGFNPGVFKERIKQIKEDPNARWMGLGDMGDHIYYSDPRFSINEIDGDITIGDMRQGILGQIRKLCDLLEPIKDKCWGIGTGNHEETIVKRYHVDPAREIAFRLDRNYLGWSNLTILSVGTQNPKVGAPIVRIYANHGYGGGRKHGAQINKIEDAMRVAEADIYVTGHVHGNVTSRLEIMGIGKFGNPKTVKRVFVVASSFQDATKKGVTTYAERMMMPQATLGSPIVQCRWFGKSKELDMRVIS